MKTNEVNEGTKWKVYRIKSSLILVHCNRNAGGGDVLSRIP